MSDLTPLDDLRSLLAEREKVGAREKVASATGLGAVAAGAIAIAFAGAIPVIGPLTAILGAVASGYGLVKYGGDEQEIAHRIGAVLEQSFARIEAKLTLEQKLAYECILATLATRRLVPLAELYAILRDLHAAAEIVILELSQRALITTTTTANGAPVLSFSHALIGDFVQQRLMASAVPPVEIGI